MTTNDAEQWIVWSKGTYRLREIVENPGNCAMYYLGDDGPEQTFVSEELMLFLKIQRCLLITFRNFNNIYPDG